jgi:opacity protein-like surface antigen
MIEDFIKKANFLIILTVILLMTIQNAKAQNNLSLEVRTGADFATEKLGDADLNTGFGFEATLAYRFMPHLSAYAGWGWHKFTADESFAGSDVDFEETGYTFGLQFLHPMGLSNLDYYIRAGGIYNHIEVENNDGNITADSGHGLGWQAEAGLVFPLNDNWSLKPGVRYRSLSRDIEIENVTTSTDLRYIELGVGISVKF